MSAAIYLKRYLSVALAASLTALALSAQTPAAVPLPAQLSTAKTVFLANAGSTPANNQLAVMAYTDVYQDFAAKNQYQLSTAPSEADLTFEVSVISVYEGQTFAQYLQLVIRDPKSQALLWTTAENIATAAREKTLEKNVSDSAAKLVADLATFTSNKSLTSQPDTTPKKTRLSDNKEDKN